MSEVPSWLSDDNDPKLTNSAIPNAASATTNSHYNEALPGWTATSDNDNDMELQQPPPTPLQGATADDNKETPATASRPETWGDYCLAGFRRDGRLLLITIFIIVLMNIPVVQFAFYPFTIFSTWIHEVCHGVAAVMAGGRIAKLEIFADTSGLAYTSVPPDRRGFVVSAGYQGTAVTGCLLLLFRRTKRGPRTGTMALAFLMLLSVMLWIRNAFGMVFISVFGLILVIAAWRLPSTWMRNLYLFLAITTTMNAITSINNLFGSSHEVNGQKSSTDAHTMADIKGGTSSLWAMIWLLLGILLMLLGIVFAIPGPDEVADFACCGVCQDFGLFAICNYPGQRVLGHLMGSRRRNSSTTGSTTTATAGGGEGVDVSA